MEISDVKINEGITQNPLNKIDINLYNVIKSVCKIIASNTIGTGFFIKLYKDNKEFYCLMTNEHIITKDMIDAKQKITIIYDTTNKNKEIILNKDERYIKEYTNMDIDVTIIEIIKEDKIKEKYFLLPNIEDKILLNKNIYIVQYPHGDLSYSKGKILKIEKNEITHDVSTNEGSSGSPIFLENTKGVIGIHKQSYKGKNQNFGDLINLIIIDLKQKLNYDNGNYYKGDIINNKANGRGILFNKNGNIIYEGDFVNDKFEGNGIYYNDNGEYYIGQFKNNLRNGKGTLYGQYNNIIYEGDFIDDNYEGNGKYYYENGDYYIGQWKNSKEHGKGIKYYKNNKIKYEGDFIDGKYEGNGKYNGENGDFYIGQWKESYRHGKGIEYYKNGNIKYEGDFVFENYEGNGKYYFENGNYYIGQWKEGYRHGKGIEYYKNGKIKYDGDSIKGLYEGNGKYYWEDGSYYIGQFKNNLRHGKGILYYGNGNINYEGDFLNDELEGKGKYYFENGEHYIGQFKNNFRHGKGILYDQNNNIIYEGNFIKDKYEENKINYNINGSQGIIQSKKSGQNPVPIIYNIKKENKNEEIEKNTFIRPSQIIFNEPNNIGFLKNYYGISIQGIDVNGNSKINQDYGVLLRNIKNIKNFNIFGILDGHGKDGQYISQFASKFITSQIINHPKIKNLNDPRIIHNILIENNFKIIIDSFLSCDEQLKFQNFDAYNSGTSCTLIIQIDQNILCANVGDSKAIVIYDDINFLKSIELSKTHKPHLEEEKNRILLSGGEIRQEINEFGENVGPLCVWMKGLNYPGLTISRTIGDLNCKNIGVISRPSVCDYKINKNTKFIVLATKGVWKFLTSENIIDIGKSFYLENNPSGLCQKIQEISKSMWQCNDIIVDDISISVMFF